MKPPPIRGVQDTRKQMHAKYELLALTEVFCVWDGRMKIQCQASELFFKIRIWSTVQWNLNLPFSSSSPLGSFSSYVWDKNCLYWEAHQGPRGGSFMSKEPALNWKCVSSCVQESCLSDVILFVDLLLCIARIISFLGEVNHEIKSVWPRLIILLNIIPNSSWAKRGLCLWGTRVHRGSQSLQRGGNQGSRCCQDLCFSSQL